MCWAIVIIEDQCARHIKWLIGNVWPCGLFFLFSSELLVMWSSLLYLLMGCMDGSVQRESPYKIDLLFFLWNICCEADKLERVTNSAWRTWILQNSFKSLNENCKTFIPTTKWRPDCHKHLLGIKFDGFIQPTSLFVVVVYINLLIH